MRRPATRAEVRKWVAGFEAVAAADREAARREGPDGEWASRVSLSMIAAASGSGLDPSRPDPVRERDARSARKIWTHLRRAYRSR